MIYPEEFKARCKQAYPTFEELEAEVARLKKDPVDPELQEDQVK